MGSPSCGSLRLVGALAGLAGLLLLTGLVPAAAQQRDRQTCLQGGDAATKIAGCSRMIERGSRLSAADLAGAYDSRAKAYTSQGQDDLALQDYDQAIRLAPKRASAWNNRGEFHSRRADYDRAIRDLDEAIRLNPKDAVGYLNRGFSYNGKGDYDRAIRDLDEAIRLNPKSPGAYTMRAISHNGKGDYDRAIRDLDEAIRLNPKLEGAYQARGLAHLRKGTIDAAIRDFDAALRLDPKYTAAFSNRGLAYERKGDLVRARADYNAALATSNTYVSTPPALDLARERLLALESSPRAAPAVAPMQAALAPPNMAAAASAPERRVALVIGNAAYAAVSQLPNPRRDAEAMAAALRRAGFTSIRTESDTSRERLLNALRAFEDEAENADWAVIYFAGHGIEIGGVNYLVPVDAKLRADRDVQDEAVALERVLSAIERATKLRLVILDACRDNPFIGQMRRTVATRSIGRGLARIEPEGGTLVAYAAKHGQVALDGDGANSPFVSSLVRHLNMPGLEISKLFRLVRDDVMAATGRRQEPFVYGSLPGSDFFFVQR